MILWSQGIRSASVKGIPLRIFYAALIEGMDIEPASNEIRDDVGLEIGEGQDEIGVQREDLVDIRGRERTYSRFLAPSLWRTHHVTGYAYDAILFAQ